MKRILLLVLVLNLNSCDWNAEIKEVSLNHKITEMQIWYDEFEPNPLTNRPFKTTRDRDWMKNNAAFNSKIDNRISCFSLYQEAKKIEAGISITKIESCEFDNLYVEFYTSSNDTLWLGIGDDINVININGSCFQNSLEMMQYLYSTSMLETIDTSKFNKK